MERFNQEKLHDVETRNSNRLKSQIGLQLGKTWDDDDDDDDDDVDISRAWEYKR
jgi:hypothetical protein